MPPELPHTTGHHKNSNKCLGHCFIKKGLMRKSHTKNEIIGERKAK